MSNDVRIAISGKSGCGNSTVSAIVAGKLGLALVNYTFKSIAAETGIPFAEVCRKAEEDPGYDYQVDERQVELARARPCVLGSRLAVWLLEDADVKVYLEASPAVRAGRIRQREGGHFYEILEKMVERDERDHARYLKLYGIDIDRYDFVDLVVDTERKTPEQVAEIIISRVRDRAG
ncbi:MAG: cytidylate kinase family protein [Spirochaetales bacterium]|nr:cytidylate kinase family protein [Spirochaetales bacterium]